MSRRHHLSRVFALGCIIITVTPLRAAEEAFPIRPIPGLELTRGETFQVKGARKPGAFRFNDGRICLAAAEGGSLWSDDAGKTWRDGHVGPLDKMALDLGGGQVISIARDTVPRPDGKFTVQLRSSSDNWKTVAATEAIADVPLATSAGGDTADTVAGMLMHHGIVKLRNGDLLATLYGNYKGDRIPFDAYPPDELRAFKYRTIVVRSADGAKTWGDPRTVAYDTMLGARNAPDAAGNKLTLVPAVTQEGFGEADLAIAPNGEIVCVMRSGGASGEGVLTIFPTPLYASRSSDDGKTWTSPVGIADRGVCPSLLTLDNGVMVCVYSRPGFWLIFSDDSGKIWKGATQFESGKDYCYIVPTAGNSFIVFWERDAQAHGTRFTVRKR